MACQFSRAAPPHIRRIMPMRPFRAVADGARMSARSSTGPSLGVAPACCETSEETRGLEEGRTSCSQLFGGRARELVPGAFRIGALGASPAEASAAVPTEAVERSCGDAPAYRVASPCAWLIPPAHPHSHGVRALAAVSVASQLGWRQHSCEDASQTARHAVGWCSRLCFGELSETPRERGVAAQPESQQSGSVDAARLREAMTTRGGVVFSCSTSGSAQSYTSVHHAVRRIYEEPHEGLSTVWGPVSHACRVMERSSYADDFSARLWRPPVPSTVPLRDPRVGDASRAVPLVRIEMPATQQGSVHPESDAEATQGAVGEPDEGAKREYRCNKVRTDKKDRKRAFPQRGFWKKQNFLQNRSNTTRLAFAVQGVDLLKLKRLRWGEVRKGNTGWWTDDWQSANSSSPPK
ncbi:hypothetical protein BESB_025760 [Besnoitia besnoiti]|uniref:Uncharacterized protein n=1 Tax=Besnoitia besnoiti TaxID=94643 RepID=A0A2A9M884_BESBE|nr:uncharacterized protein BESB_025760 [Besnoitia besnoiti]PFH31602.1 hypothetical protein BESB_025760 [Besnoitia besnoiti]